MKNKPDLSFDIRVVDRYIREGSLTKDDLEDYLKKLPDVTDKGCPLIIEDEETEENDSSEENIEEISE
ncbi:hypothetical protein MYX76_06990 [Desulfobacterota bacterium AH_259_B03_O07]|nr:hypothetical protein [Desulfobacterota bacterium AH_259_B03_O07]